LPKDIRRLMMNTFSKIADGLASWLNFEVRAGRKNLFSEAYLANPLGQLLQYRFPGRVIAEVQHPILGPEMSGPGRRPSIDFVIDGGRRPYEIAIETKWISKSPTLLRDIVRDVIRLDMLNPGFAKECILVVAGRRGDFEELFAQEQFQPHPTDIKRKHILPMNNYSKSSVRMVPTPKFRKDLYTSVLKPYRTLEISKTIPLERSGPYPKNANINTYQVYIWRIRKYYEGEKFTPNDFFEIN
jgi:hypothetical protein